MLPFSYGKASRFAAAAVSCANVLTSCIIVAAETLESPTQDYDFHALINWITRHGTATAKTADLNGSSIADHKNRLSFRSEL